MNGIGEISRMANKEKKDLKPFEKSIKEYHARDGAVNQFIENLKLKHGTILDKILNNKDLIGKGKWVDDKGFYDAKTLKSEDGKTNKLHRELSKEIHKEIKKTLKPLIESHYNLQFDEKKDSAFMDDFYENFLQIHEDHIHDLVRNAGDRFGADIYHKAISNPHVEQMSGRLYKQVNRVIDTEQFFDEYIKHLKIEDYIKPEQKSILKKSPQEAKYLITQILNAQENKKPIEYTTLENIASQYSQATEGKGDLSRFLYNPIKKKEDKEKKKEKK